MLRGCTLGNQIKDIKEEIWGGGGATRVAQKLRIFPAPAGEKSLGFFATRVGALQFCTQVCAYLS